MPTTSDPEIAALWETLEQHDKEIAEFRGSLNRLNRIVRASLRQAVWQSIALAISIGIAMVSGLAYQTRVLNNRFDQIEKSWQESDKRFAERSELSERNFHTYIEQSEKNWTARMDDLKQKVPVRRK